MYISIRKEIHTTKTIHYTGYRDSEKEYTNAVSGEENTRIDLPFGLTHLHNTLRTTDQSEFLPPWPKELLSGAQTMIQQPRDERILMRST